MKLFYSSASPFARKVLVCARERGLAGRIEVVPASVAPNKANLELARHNPLMKVPALQRDDGSALYDSAVICEYLDSLGDAPPLFPPSGETRWRVLRLHALGDGILDAALLARYETLSRPEALRWPEWLDGQYAKIDHALNYLEGNPAEFAGGVDIGTITVGCALGYLDFRFAHRPWRDSRPRLTRWFETFGARESFAKTRPDA